MITGQFMNPNKYSMLLNRQIIPLLLLCLIITDSFHPLYEETWDNGLLIIFSPKCKINLSGEVVESKQLNVFKLGRYFLECCNLDSSIEQTVQLNSISDPIQLSIYEKILKFWKDTESMLLKQYENNHSSYKIA